MEAGVGDMREIPQCRGCTHFYITYNPSRPYGCRAMRFTSRRNPALVVYESSGLICQLYTPRPDGPGKKGKDWIA